MILENKNLIRFFGSQQKESFIFTISHNIFDLMQKHFQIKLSCWLKSRVVAKTFVYVFRERKKIILQKS